MNRDGKSYCNVAQNSHKWRAVADTGKIFGSLEMCVFLQEVLASEWIWLCSGFLVG